MELFEHGSKVHFYFGAGFVVEGAEALGDDFLDFGFFDAFGLAGAFRAQIFERPLDQLAAAFRLHFVEGEHHLAEAFGHGLVEKIAPFFRGQGFKKCAQFAIFAQGPALLEVEPIELARGFVDHVFATRPLQFPDGIFLQIGRQFFRRGPGRAHPENDHRRHNPENKQKEKGLARDGHVREYVWSRLYAGAVEGKLPVFLDKSIGLVRSKTMTSWRLIFLVFGIGMGRSLAQPAAPPPAADQLYRQYCLTCHGEKLDMGLGGSLIDGEWTHGGTDAALARVITEGLPDLGMTGFGGVLSSEQIRSLVIYLREQEKQARYARTEFPRPAVGEVTRTDRASYRLESVAEGLEIPWGIDFLPDGRFLVTERPGRVRLIEADGNVLPPVEGVPTAIHHGQGGMMAVAVHPDYAENGWIYLGYSDGVEGELPTLTKIVRGRIKDNRWVDEETIWQGDRSFYTKGGVHFGTRILFRDGYVFFGIGDRGTPPMAQDLSTPMGKIFRLHEDGAIPKDNPLVDRPDALPEIWSFGHRNPQGMAFDPRDGGLYATEHGPRGGDEFNRVEPGRNYGWPVITYGMNYNGTPITGLTEKEGLEQPLVQWTPSIAACGLDVSSSNRFPGWKNDFFAGGLAAQEVRRLRVEGGRVTEQEVVVSKIGRVRDVRFGPDGSLYVVLNGPDKIVRLVPAP